MLSFVRAAVVKASLYSNITLTKTGSYMKFKNEVICKEESGALAR